MGFLEITRKDLRLLTRDRRALVVLVGLPMAFIAILGLSTGRLLGWRNDNQLLKLAVVDQNDSRTSQHVIERLESIDGVQLSRVSSAAVVEQQVADRTVTVGVVIGSDFENRVIALGPRDIFDTTEGRMRIGLADLDISIQARSESVMVRSVVDQIVLFAALQAILPDSARRAGARDKVRDLLLGKGEGEGDTESGDDEAAQPPVDVDVDANSDKARAASDPRKSSARNPVYQTIVPGYTVMFAFFLVNIMARSFITERELGTLSRLRIAPISAVDVLLGKTLPFLVISLAQTVVLFLFGRLLFGMSWGSQPWLLLPIVFCTSLAATGLGLLIATLVKTDSQVSAYANFLVITLAGISGCFMPRDWLPVTMQNVSLATPHSWALIAYGQALTNDSPNLGVIARSCGMLCAFAGVFFLAGCWKFRGQR
jgi:ABC-2 type transport system permease protein